MNDKLITPTKPKLLKDDGGKAPVNPGRGISFVEARTAKAEGQQAIYLKNKQLREQLKAAGQNPDDATDDRNPVEKALNLRQHQGAFMDAMEVITRPMSAVQSTLTTHAEADKGENPGMFDRFWGGLSGHRQVETAEFLQNALGIDVENMGSAGKFVTTFVADVLTDPLIVGSISAEGVKFASSGLMKVVPKTVREGAVVTAMGRAAGASREFMTDTASKVLGAPVGVAKSGLGKVKGRLDKKQAAYELKVEKGTAVWHDTIRANMRTLPVLTKNMAQARDIIKAGQDTFRSMFAKYKDPQAREALARVAEQTGTQRHLVITARNRVKAIQEQFGNYSRQVLGAPAESGPAKTWLKQRSDKLLGRVSQLELEPPTEEEVKNLMGEDWFNKNYQKHKPGTKEFDAAFKEVYEKVSGHVFSIYETHRKFDTTMYNILKGFNDQSAHVTEDVTTTVTRAGKEHARVVIPKGSRILAFVGATTRSNKAMLNIKNMLKEEFKAFNPKIADKFLNDNINITPMSAVHEGSTQGHYLVLTRQLQSSIGEPTLNRLQAMFETMGGMMNMTDADKLSKLLSEGEITLHGAKDINFYKELKQRFGNAVEGNPSIGGVSRIRVNNLDLPGKTEVIGKSDATVDATLEAKTAEAEADQAKVLAPEEQVVDFSMPGSELATLKRMVAANIRVGAKQGLPVTRQRLIGSKLLDELLPRQVRLIQSQISAYGMQLGYDMELMGQLGYLRHIPDPIRQMERHRQAGLRNALGRQAALKEMDIGNVASAEKTFSMKYRGTVKDINAAYGADFFMKDTAQSLAEQLNIMPHSLLAGNVAAEAVRNGMIRVLDEPTLQRISAENPMMPINDVIKQALPREYRMVNRAELSNVTKFLEVMDNISADGVSKFADLQGIKDSEGIVIMHKGLYEQLRLYTKISNDEIGKAVGWIHKNFTTPWKKVTTFSGAYHIRNMTTNVINLYLGGMSPVALVKHHGAATKKLWTLRNKIVPKMEKAFRDQKTYEAIEGTLKDLDPQKFLDQVLTAEEKDLFNTYTDLTQRGVLGNTFLTPDMHDIIEAAAKFGQKDGVYKKLIGNISNRTAKASYDIANFSDEASRWAAYDWASTSKGKFKMERMGLAKDNPAQFVKMAMFDFNSLSPFESQYMKGIFPFYSWMRLNLEFQFKNFVKNPGRYNKFGYLWRSGQRLAAPDDKETPDWLIDNFAMPIGNGNFLNISPPMSEIDDVLSPKILASMHPALKIVLENLTGKDFFSQGEKKESGWKGAGSDLISMIPQGAFAGRTIKAIQRMDSGALYGLSGGVIRHADPEEVRMDKSLREESQLRDMISKKQKEGQYIPSWQEVLPPQPAPTTGNVEYGNARFKYTRTRRRR